MSRASNLTLWAACGISCGTIGFVMYKQWADKQKLHDGVLRDIERQQRKKIENVYVLQKQMELARVLKQQQKEDDAVALQLLEDSKKGKQ